MRTVAKWVCPENLLGLLVLLLLLLLLFLLVVQLVIGRSPVSWASIPDQEVSGKHAWVRWSDTQHCWQLVRKLGGGEGSGGW